MWLLLIALIFSGVVAFLGAGFLALDHLIPSKEYLRATFNWWIGDAVAIGSITPFILIHVLPRLRRFVGDPEPANTLQDTVVTGRHEFHGIQRAVESALIAACIAAVLWIALSGHWSRGDQMFYLLFLPLIWVAVRRGLRGATTAILAMDSGIILALRIYPRPASELTVLQLLMLVISFAGLVLGALISERDAGELRLSREEGRMRLLLESTGEAVYGVNTQGECTFFNLAMLRLLRWMSEYYGHPLGEVVSIAIPKAIWALSQKFEAKGKLPSLEETSAALDVFSNKREAPDLTGAETEAAHQRRGPTVLRIDALHRQHHRLAANREETLDDCLVHAALDRRQLGWRKRRYMTRAWRLPPPPRPRRRPQR